MLAALSLTIAAAGPLTEAAGVALRSDPVYVDAGARALVSSDREDEITDKVADLDTPVFVAFLPEAAVREVGGDPSDLPAAIAESTGIRGTYVVVAGSSFRVDSNSLSGGVAEDLATAVARDSDNAVEAVESFLDRLGGLDSDPGSGSGSGSSGSGSSDSGSGGNGTFGLVVIGAIVVGGVVLLTRSSRRRAAVDTQALQAAQQDLRAELAVLADDVLRLEPEVVAAPAAQQDYDAAVSRYRWLEAAIPSIDSPDDPPRIQRAMTEAKYAMARAQAIVRGQEPPPPPTELSAPGRYGEPAVVVDDDDEYRRPRYSNQRDRDGGWYGGGFFGGNGLFTGLLLGSMFSGGFGGGGGHGDSHDRGGDNDSGGGGAFGGFGDAGGGDFGGGDAGGGDFGGD